MDSSIIYRFLIIIFIFTTSHVKAIEFQGKFMQGHFILGKTNPDAEIIVGKKKVTPPEEFYVRIKKENKMIGDARAINSNLPFFKDKFIMPVEGIISGVYGSQRILNGIPKWPHYGIDFAQKKGTPIKAMNNGVATLVEHDLFYTGATLIFDHGHGVSTLYMHLDKIFIKKGDHVKKGDIIGTVGSSGRSTGPHLDVRLNWFDTRLDPATVLDIE